MQRLAHFVLLASLSVLASTALAFDNGQYDNVAPDIRGKVGDWYTAEMLPEMRRVLGKEPNLNDYLPNGSAAYYLQYYYIVTNPHPANQRKLLDDAGDGSAYSAQHAIYHPLLRAAAANFGFFDLMVADPKSGRITYGVDKEVDLGASLRTGPSRQSNLSVAVARCAATADRSAVCLEDFAPYAPSGGAPIAFMAAPVIDEGTVVGVLVATVTATDSDGGTGSGGFGTELSIPPDHPAPSASQVRGSELSLRVPTCSA